jgi:Bacterial Ig domain
MKVSKLIFFITFFLLISSAAWASSPVIFYSDLTSGPNTGGQNNEGVFVTVWGNNFGATQGSSYVTVGGGKVNNYPTWTNTEITFQLGPLAATGNIVVSTSSGASNVIPFTVRSGNIYFVNPSASANGSGTYTSPFNHLASAYNVLAAGDTVYVMAGTIENEVDGCTGWHSILCTTIAATQTSPIAWVAYPNATVTLQATGATQTYPSGSDNVQYIFRSNGGTWQTISKFYLVDSGTQAAVSGNLGWRVVGNNVQTTNEEYDAIDAIGDYFTVLGNEVHNSYNDTYNNEAHSIYIGGESLNFVIAWNYLHDDYNQGWEIQLYHQGERQGTIHDNLITNAGGNEIKGILIGDVDTGEDQTTVENQLVYVYNNILYNLGVNNGGGAIQAVSGTAYIYNNTIYGSLDSAGTIQFPAGGIGPGGGHPVWYLANNIIYNSLSNSLYLSDGNGNAPAWTNFALLTNNNYYGSGNGPSEDPRPVNANPQFVSGGTNFQLQASSPDINAGYNTTSIVVEDLNGLLRSSTPSIGAYEYSGSSSFPPVVAITNPASGISVSNGSNVTITATASETNGTITNISLYNGAALLGSSSSSPYTYTMTDPAAGIYTLTAVATDAKGVSTTSIPAIVTVTPQTLPSSPVVNITSPASGSSYTAGSNVTITTTASETNGTIANISLYNGSGILLGTSSTSPYNYVDSNMAAGAYSFYAIAKDINGVSTTSGAITVTVTAQAGVPAVAIASPANGSTYIQGSTFTITANASETGGTIAQVQYYSGTYLLATATTSPYTASWTNSTTGTFSLNAKAIDANGVSTMSNPITITVTTSPTAPKITTQPSSVTVITPASATFSVAATGTPAPGFQWMQSVNGGAFTNISGANNSSYTTAATTTANSGTQLECVVTNASGSVTSNAATLTVNPQPSLPTVSLTAPSNNASFPSLTTIFLSANASEANGTIAQVQFFNGSTLLYTDTSAPYNYAWATNLLPGSYTLTAQATDSRGIVVTSAPVTVNITLSLKQNPSTPVAAIISPSNASSISAGSNLTITASASESNGSIAEVYFYNGSSFLGSSNVSPYSYTWTNIPAGTYTLTAQAIDINGVSVTSNPVTVTAASTAPSSPVVAITSPANASSITTGSNLTITASASETNGSIAQVQFYNGSTLLATDTSSPYSYTFNNILTGSYTLTAKATDTRGVSTTSSSVAVTVTALPPVVSITSPANGSNFTAGSDLNITASASEVNGSISGVYFYNGTTFLGSSSTSPYSYKWTNVPAGSYTLIAVAIDVNGVSTTSNATTVTLTAPAVPVVSITSPANGSSLTAGSNLNITAGASETNGSIAQVQFYNGSTLLGTDSTSPYTYNWTNVPVGSYTLTAKATDTNGVSTTSSPVTVTATAAPSSPVVSITSPANGSNYKTGSLFTITASASETGGTIAQVQYYSGTNLLATATTSPYTASWTNNTTGTFTLTAKATDANGISTTSSPITISVSTASSSPVVAITNPANGSSYTTGSTVILAANASETGGTITQVKFYNGSTLLATDSSSPYTYNWTNVPAGSYTVTAKATDTNGVSTTSSPVTVTVTSAPSLPVVSLTAPSNNSNINLLSSVTLTAAASETNGSITQVQFYDGSTLLYTATNSPYNYTWTPNLLPGSYTITARAIDSSGVAVTSAPVTVNIIMTL